MSLVIRTGRAAALAVLALAPSLAAARDFKVGDLVIQSPWARATPNGAKVAGGYMTITNHGTAPETLTGGTFEVARDVAVHTMSVDGGVMRMRPAGPLEIPPGGAVTLSPAGTHVMFSGLTQGLKKGDEVGGTLSFARAGVVPVRYAVEGIGAKAPAHGAAMPGMDME